MKDGNKWRIDGVEEAFTTKKNAQEYIDNLLAEHNKDDADGGS